MTTLRSLEYVTLSRGSSDVSNGSDDVSGGVISFNINDLLGEEEREAEPFVASDDDDFEEEVVSPSSPRPRFRGDDEATGGRNRDLQ